MAIAAMRIEMTVISEAINVADNMATLTRTVAIGKNMDACIAV